MPAQILIMWLTGLLSVGVIAAGAHFAYDWYRRSWSFDPVAQQAFFAPDFGANEATLAFVGALLLFLFAIAGKMAVRCILRLTSGSGALGDDAPRQTRDGATGRQRIRNPDGSELQVEIYGPDGAPPIVMTHGWGLNSTAWYYAKRELGQRYRLILWDQPGLGLSTRPADRNFTLEKLARDLHSVLALAGDQPAILLGHSIGGMIVLTFCRLFPEDLRTRVAGLVLTATTYTNPVRTVAGAPFFTAIETPILKPLMYLTVALSPLLWLMNWMSYLNGSSHTTTKLTSFGGTESWSQIDFAALFQAKASPAVLARGMLGMMRYDATGTLSTIPSLTLVVPGEIDPVCKPSASERMRAAIPHAELRSLPQAKHLGFLEHHANYASAVEEFARSLEQPAVGSGEAAAAV